MKMAMTSRSVSVAVVFFVAWCSSQNVRSTELWVGGDKGWTIPNARQEDRDMYNEWASKHRFKINDTLRFKYEKDSVLVVTEAEYHKCKASHPIFFSNNEDTLFRLDRSGLFYFISGVAGHCQRGQKMIIKVLEEAEQYSPPPSSNSSAAASHDHTTDAHRNSGVTSTSASILLPVALGGVFFVAPRLG